MFHKDLLGFGTSFQTADHFGTIVAEKKQEPRILVSLLKIWKNTTKVKLFEKLVPKYSEKFSENSEK